MAPLRGKKTIGGGGAFQTPLNCLLCCAVPGGGADTYKHQVSMSSVPLSAVPSTPPSRVPEPKQSPQTSTSPTAMKATRQNQQWDTTSVTSTKSDTPLIGIRRNNSSLHRDGGDKTDSKNVRSKSVGSAPSLRKVDSAGGRDGSYRAEGNENANCKEDSGGRIRIRSGDKKALMRKRTSSRSSSSVELSCASTESESLSSVDADPGGNGSVTSGATGLSATDNRSNVATSASANRKGGGRATGTKFMKNAVPVQRPKLISKSNRSSTWAGHENNPNKATPSEIKKIEVAPTEERTQKPKKHRKQQQQPRNKERQPQKQKMEQHRQRQRNKDQSAMQRSDDEGSSTFSSSSTSASEVSEKGEKSFTTNTSGSAVLSSGTRSKSSFERLRANSDRLKRLTGINGLVSPSKLSSSGAGGSGKTKVSPKKIGDNNRNANKKKPHQLQTATTLVLPSKHEDPTTVPNASEPSTPQHRRQSSAPEPLSPTTKSKQDRLREQILKSRQLQSALRHVRAEQREKMQSLRQTSAEMSSTSSSGSTTGPGSINDSSDELGHMQIISKQNEEQHQNESYEREVKKTTTTTTTMASQGQFMTKTVSETVMVSTHKVNISGNSSKNQPDNLDSNGSLTPTTAATTFDSALEGVDSALDGGENEMLVSVKIPGDHFTDGDHPSPIDQSGAKSPTAQKQKQQNHQPNNITVVSAKAKLKTQQQQQEEKNKNTQQSDRQQSSISPNTAGRASRQIRLMRQNSSASQRSNLAVGEQPNRPNDPNQANRIKIHVYDLIHSETWVETPWGCEFPLGKCFITLNNGLHFLGTGAYHAGIEVNGVEYAYGSSEIEGLSGVFTCPPKLSPGYEYRTTLDFGKIKTLRRDYYQVVSSVEKESNNDDKGLRFRIEDTSDGNVNADSGIKTSEKDVTRTDMDGVVYRDVDTFVEGSAIMRQMAKEYMGVHYDLFRKNCCTFVKDACLRLGVSEKEIPTWFLNLADAGVVTEDALANVDSNVCAPIKGYLEVHGEDDDQSLLQEPDRLSEEPVASGSTNSGDVDPDEGFEVITTQKQGYQARTTELEIVRVEESFERDEMIVTSSKMSAGVRETVSLTH